MIDTILVLGKNAIHETIPREYLQLSFLFDKWEEIRFIECFLPLLHPHTHKIFADVECKEVWRFSWMKNNKNINL